MKATIRIAPAHCGHTSGSTSKICCSNAPTGGRLRWARASVRPPSAQGCQHRRASPGVGSRAADWRTTRSTAWPPAPCRGCESAPAREVLAGRRSRCRRWAPRTSRSGTLRTSRPWRRGRRSAAPARPDSAGRPNPYAKRLKKPVTIRLDASTIAYFKKLAGESEIPYQMLINLYLRDCAASGRRLPLSWRSSRAGDA